MGTAVLRPLRRYGPSAAIQIKRAPYHRADLGSPRARQHEQFHDASEVVVPCRAPHVRKFAVVQHALARFGALGGERADDRVVLAQPALHRPREHARQHGPCTRRRDLAAGPSDGQDARGDIAPGNAINGHAMQRPEVARVCEIAPRLGEGARADIGCLLPAEIVVDQRLQCVLVALSARRFLLLRVFAERNFSQNLLRGQSGLLGTEHVGGAEQHAPRGSGASVLHDPRLADSVAAVAQPQTEARHVAIEVNGVGFARRKGEAGDRFGV